jgi:hypothetical protein
VINRRKRRDGNHAEILAVFAQCGWKCVDTSQLGGSVPDAFCAKRGRGVVAVEIKTATGKLTTGQSAWHADWPGETVIVRDCDDVLRLSSG